MAFGLGKLFGGGKKTIQPWSQQKGYKGTRRRKGHQASAAGRSRRGSGVFPGIRLTPLNDRVRGYFR